MTFPAKLTELIEKATKGPWRQAGSSLQGDEDFSFYIAEYIQSHDAELIAYLVNHAEAIRDLVVAADKIGSKVTDASTLQISIADILEMKEALAKLEEA